MGKFKKSIVQSGISNVNVNLNKTKLPIDSQTNKQAQNLQNNQEGVSYQANQANAPTIQGSGNTININYNQTQIEEVKKESINNHRKFFSESNLYPDIKFNREVAILYVTAEDGQYRVLGFNNSQKLLETKLSKPPCVSFTKFINGHDNAERISKMREFPGLMRKFSDENSEVKKIRRWLIDLQTTLEENFQEKLKYVVINDRTDFEIPWEMLRLKDNYLGVSLVTTRWQDIPHPDCFDRDHLPLEFELSNCSGDIVAYINTNELNSVAQERMTIEQFNVQHFEDVREFLNHLEETNNSISLMFIASHGLFGNDISQIEFGEIRNSNQRISLIYLEDYDFNFFKNSPSIVFMNACHSGRLLIDSELNINHNYRTGFATFFLKRGAKGVIGTLSKVLDEYASQVTDIFFEEYRCNQTLSVAEILRNIREKVAKDIKVNRNEKTELLFISTFMYVYYGNPMTTLQLTENRE